MSVVIFAIALALFFDIINGFHDSANSIATIVSTKVLSPKFAVLWAAFFNFIAMFIFAPKVANTVSKIIRIDSVDPAFLYVVLSALAGAVFWDLLTWWFGLPTSSSHALLGGLAGAGIAHSGFGVIRWEKLTEAMAFIPLAPVIGAVLGFGVMIAVYHIFRKWHPKKVDNVFRKGQLFSAAMYSLGHGGNDAQKTMGIIVAILVAAGIFSDKIQLSITEFKTLWIILSCHLAMGIGTALGGWRIVKTMGMKITRLKPVHGFCAETAGATTLFLATTLGIPISTTHTIAGSIIGVGSTTNFSSIKWIVAARIVVSWIVTIPLSALMSAIVFWLIKLIHPHF
ncbi:MAG: inorganic phosphate transporter [Ignavibacteria bacterium GWB2_35_12]|nr:MAG: inorganic phosphate transporter [Ignavibacteria bacterium GWA2_35_8]OGU41130.1 MAG: inorganic phosphate transporter [Ignavibacteria bacterium GWB2_35_12]OGV22947.1 MAG: inorganic phosphate transporter [Ignavibacteria bacterium RIFOXYC2_FULL_35_21]